jgi:hypothetical protein
MAPQENEVQLLERLVDFAGKLEGGELEIGEFNTWFMNSQWEARMANNSSALRLGWDIQNILYEWQDYPDVIPTWRVAENIREAMEQYGVYRQPMGSRSSSPS